MLNSSNLECNIYYFHLHLNVVDCWENFKCIEFFLQPINFECSLLEKENILTKNRNIIS